MFNKKYLIVFLFIVIMSFLSFKKQTFDNNKSIKYLVIIPYRDRKEHLKIFKEKASPFLREHLKDVMFLVAEQDNKKLFNKGKLYNIAYLASIKLNYNANYIIFNDVDHIPVNNANYISSNPNAVVQVRGPPHTMGGISMFPTEALKKVNGWSNSYVGWGREDVDIEDRLISEKITIEKKNLENLYCKSFGEYAKSLKGPIGRICGEYNCFDKPRNHGLDSKNKKNIFEKIKDKKCSFDVLKHEKRSDNIKSNKKTYNEKKKDSYKKDGLNQLNIENVKIREIENDGDFLHLGFDIY
jgi:adenylylsulfate kinase-like enzyme